MTRRALWLLGMLTTAAACRDEPPPPPPASSSAAASTQAAASTTAKSMRNAEAIQADIDAVNKELAGLRKTAARTFAQDKAKRVNAKIEARRKRLEALEAELAGAPQ